VDIGTIIGGLSRFSTYSVNGCVNSTRHGKRFLASNLQDLLVEVIEDILLQPLRWNKVIAEVIAQITSVQCKKIAILPFGPANTSKTLVKGLLEAGITTDIKNTNKSRSLVSSNPRNGDIAIVGMSGRFPGGENLEEFWKTLLDGLDLHKKVCCSI
jgi:naphtho-gamma-pyrone polyketide synthase